MYGKKSYSKIIKFALIIFVSRLLKFYFNQILIVLFIILIDITYIIDKNITNYVNYSNNSKFYQSMTKRNLNLRKNKSDTVQFIIIVGTIFISNLQYVLDSKQV